MPLDAQDLEILKNMQRLCTDLENDVRNLSAFNEYLQSVNERYETLGSLYESDWLRLSESEKLDAAQIRQVEAMVAEGGFSVLGQDTIWNALSDTRIEYVQLLKALAKMI